MEILAGVAVDHSTWDDKLTTSNDYDDVQCHWPYSSSVRSSYWNCECLGGKTLYFTAVTNNLLVKVLGSLDEGVTFPITVESEFSVAVGTPVLKPIGVYFNALKIQVKPAVAGVHGTLSVIGSGSSLPGATGIELAGDLPDTAANDLAHIHAKTDNLNVGDQAKAASVSVTPATDITDGRYIGDIKFGESLPAGTNLVGVIGLDQTTPGANEVVVKSQTPPTTLPLPTGAATHTGQDEQSTKLDSIIAALVQLAALQDKIIGEVVNEVPNGINDTFTVDYAFVANSEQVVVNQLVKTRGASYDYVPTGASKQIVFNAGAIPPLDATINVSYWKA